MQTWKDYLKSPIPPSGGFSAYRFPGPVVHFPVLGIFGGVGFMLCYPAPWLWPLMVIWAVAGLYVGRDLTLAGHYNLLIPLVVGVIFTGLIVAGPRYIIPQAPLPWTSLGAAIIPLAIALSLLVLGGFILYVKRRVGPPEGEEEGPG